MVDNFKNNDIIYAHYDSETHDMNMTLLDGIQYNYENVPNKLWSLFKNSDHQESIFYRFIKGLGKEIKDRHVSFKDIKLNIERKKQHNESSEEQSRENSSS